MEKYGTMPPRFSKDWWIHYWTYYKLHILLGTFLVLALGHLVYTRATTVNYDLQIQYLTSDATLPSEAMSKLDKKTAKLSKDVTENKKIETKTYFDFLPSFDDFGNAQQLQAVQTRLIADIQTADKQLFIVDKAVADILYSYGYFLPVTEWAENPTPEQIYSEIALSLSEIDLFSEMGFDTSRLYLCVLKPNAECMKEKECVKKFENAQAVAKELVKE